MERTEAGVFDLLLRLARKKHMAAEIAGAASARTSAHRVQRREAQVSDFAPVAALKTRSGLSPDSIENWDRLWRENPALARAAHPLPIGWVQEAEGQIVGYMGSIPLLYQYGDEPLLAVATTCYAVDPAYRASSLGLVASFFKQDGCDLFLDTTATPAAGKVMRAFKSEPLPQRDYDVVLFWILNSQAFLRAALEKLQVTEPIGKLASWLGAPLVMADTFLRGRRPGSTPRRFSCRETSVETIGDDFQDLWIRKIQERPRLMACRTPEVLRWHFLVPHSRRKTHVLSCYEQGRLAGYLILQTGLSGPAGLQRAIVADLMAVGNRPEIVAELFVSSFEIARRERSDVLEILGFPEEVRQVCRTWKPFSRRYPANPFYFRTDRAPLRELLMEGESWYACPFDGDTTLSS